MTLAAVILIVAGALPAGETPAPLTIDARTDVSRPVVKALLPATIANQWPDGRIEADLAKGLLRLVRLDDKTGEEGPAVFGTYRLAGDTLRFDPDFALGSGGKYRAVLSLPGREPVRTDYEPPKAAPAEPPQVERVYPSSDKLPANLLKFYVHFSRPMRQTDGIFEQMHILDEEGKPVYDPWRRIQQWSEDGKRLTLWIHPGRVKQGVNLREELGPVLRPDHKYRLTIDADVLDLAGQPLGKAFEKSFSASAEDHERPLPQKWKLSSVKAGMTDRLVVTFPEPMDRALIERLISVRDASGKRVAGTAEAGEGETTWNFSPAQPWIAATYTLQIDDLLEDLAGNTPVRVFDADLQHPDTAPAQTILSFSPR